MEIVIVTVMSTGKKARKGGLKLEGSGQKEGLFNVLGDNGKLDMGCFGRCSMNGEHAGRVRILFDR